MAREFAARFYDSARWKRTQAAVMKAYNYTCQRCGRPAKIVHHRVWLTPDNINDPDVTLNWDNLVPLCQDCHNREHIGGRETRRGLAFDATGRLVKVGTSHNTAK